MVGFIQNITAIFQLKASLKRFKCSSFKFVIKGRVWSQHYVWILTRWMIYKGTTASKWVYMCSEINFHFRLFPSQHDISRPSSNPIIPAVMKWMHIKWHEVKGIKSFELVQILVRHFPSIWDEIWFEISSDRITEVCRQEKLWDLPIWKVCRISFLIESVLLWLQARSTFWSLAFAQIEIFAFEIPLWDWLSQY